jgi:thioredoxin reductase (NADPH)
MTTNEHHKVVILGSGPAGLTAAIYTSRANLSPVLIHGPLPGGQLTTTTEVENFPGFPEGVMGPDLMQLMEKQAIRFGTKIMVNQVVKTELQGRPFRLTLSNESTVTCEVLIIATGAAPRLLGLEEEKTLMGYGVSTCATCDGAFFRNKVIMVAGGGDSACEEAVFLTRFGSKVILVHRRDQLRASKIMQDRVLNHPKIEVLWNRQIKAIHGSKANGVTGVTALHSATNEAEEIPCDALFVAIGHIPNSYLFKGQLDMDDNGYLTPVAGSARMNIPGVFACGDVQDHVWRQAITAAGTGCMAAIEAERYLEALHQ